MGKISKAAEALKKVKTSVKEGMTKSQIKKRAAEKKEEVSQLKAKLKDQAKFDASSKSSFKGKTPDKSSKSKAIETRKVNERNKRLKKEADSKSKKTKDLDDENSAPLKFKDGSGKRGVFRKIGGAAKKAVQGAARGAYRKSIGANANVLNKALNVIAPDSKITRAVSSVVDPAILGGKGGGPKTASTNTSPKPKKAKAKAKDKVGKNRESDTSNFESLTPTMATPGEAIAPKTKRRPARMKAGGLAIKGQGKAFLKSKR